MTATLMLSHRYFVYSAEMQIPSKWTLPSTRSTKNESSLELRFASSGDAGNPLDR
jgi:hypothetical protein